MTTSTSLRIGQLAAATGLTVRTLHHYEQLGLLPLPSRTEGRQRRYGEADVRRLYVARALRDLGLSLSEVRQTLRSDGGSLREVLRSHLERVDAELGRLRRLRALLLYAAGCAEGAVPADELLATIEAMSRLSRGPRMTPAEIRAWRSLGKRLRARLDAGDAASSPRVQALAKQARGWLRRVQGAERLTPGQLEQLARLARPDELAGWDAPLLRFLHKALEAL